MVLSVAAFVARRRKKVSHDSMDLCLELVFFFAAYKLLKVAAVMLGMPSSYFYLAAFAVSAVALVYRMLRKSAGRLYNGLLLLACMGSAIGIIDAVGLASGHWFMVSASAVVAFGSLAFIMTSMHKKKDFGNDTADMVSGIAFMASAVKFWQLTLNVSCCGCAARRSRACGLACRISCRADARRQMTQRAFIRYNALIMRRHE